MKHNLPGAPRSERVPFIEGEHPSDRHARRAREAKRARRIAREMIEGLGGRLAIKGDHWVLQFGDSRVEWWPETGRAVLNQKWSKAGKAHDIDQLGALCERWKRKGLL